MGKSTRVHLRDIRQVYRIIHEIVELGDDPAAWRPHLANELIKLLHLQSSHVYVMPLPITAENAHIGGIAFGGLDETATRLWMEYGARGDLSTDPCTPAILKRSSRPFTAVRPMLATDRDWYHSGYYHDFKRQMRADDILVSIVPMPRIGIMHGLGGDRKKGDPPMARREVVCTGLIHQELARRWQLLLSNSALIERSLPPRLAQLLQHLRGSDSEKEIALKMNLSPHTVHNHIRRLYTRFNVSRRAELMMVNNNRRLRGIPRVGIAGL